MLSSLEATNAPQFHPLQHDFHYVFVVYEIGDYNPFSTMWEEKYRWEVYLWFWLYSESDPCMIFKKFF